MTGAPGTGGPFLDLDPDPAVWLIGPTPDRPAEVWVDAAVEAKSTFFGLGPDQQRERDVVAAVLGGTARQHPSPLPLFVVRWTALLETPLVLFFGLVERDDATGRAWLDHEDGPTVERPLVEELDAPDGTSLLRSFAYSHDETGAIVASVRYVVDTRHPDAWVLAHAASDQPGDLLVARDDVESLLRSVRIGTEPPR